MVLGGSATVLIFLDNPCLSLCQQSSSFVKSSSLLSIIVVVVQNHHRCQSSSLLSIIIVVVNHHRRCSKRGTSFGVECTRQRATAGRSGGRVGTTAPQVSGNGGGGGTFAVFYCCRECLFIVV